MTSSRIEKRSNDTIGDIDDRSTISATAKVSLEIAFDRRQLSMVELTG
jgi:hypothetical protein